jgi:hypothetical protein
MIGAEPEQSRRLHKDIIPSTLVVLHNNGHMVHQTAVRELLGAIDTLAAQRKPMLVDKAA